MACRPLISRRTQRSIGGVFDWCRTGRLIELGKVALTLAGPGAQWKVFADFFSRWLLLRYGEHFAQFSRFLEAEKVAAVPLMDGCLSLACLHRSKRPFILFRTSLHFSPPDDLFGTSRQLIKCRPLDMTSPVSSPIDDRIVTYPVPLVILTN